MIKQVAVIGTGMMGPGIAMLAARAGYTTRLIGRSEGSIARGLAAVDRALEEMCAHGIYGDEDVERIKENLTATTDLVAGVEDADFVVESIVEDLAVKQELFAKLDQLCPPKTILATNTSGLSPTKIGSATRRPDRVVATHFWNPPLLVPLVEVGRGEKTSQETVEAACYLMERMQKKAVVVQKDILGFIGNRLQHALFREAISLVAQGAATPEDIDQVILNSFGPRYAMIGIMEYMDMCGLDLIQAVHSYLLQDLDASDAPSPVIRQKVKDGELGMKSGKGFYDWTEQDPQRVYERRNRIFMERLK